ncbi:coniferyl aldehyde dehydrogenase [Pseudomonas sp. G5(2012)]|uniref:coniferyl aldehyde dehydrogenase n=1 Tax=Pseudomonas sp. G5(2012) TaxID=1268068 RepID=UPI0003432369|nr:coniferyl aldehyde dehydrogenase [Pseudomonas sp. G5(2012)]EPA99353.1 Coniferyl-aldehyde dehydrogenase [Pseudomonas sp. G5(2012)]
MSILGKNDAAVTAEEILNAVERMKQAHTQNGPPGVELRIDRLDRAIRLLLENSAALAEAISADFGNRSHQQSLLADVGSSVAALKHCREHLEKWMQAEDYVAPFPGVQTQVQYQPLGLVGIISPWNFPVILAFGPLAGVLAAGNRAMLKPSELTPRTSALIAELIDRYFDEDEITVVLGDKEVGALFSEQPFDHLVFTGSTPVGKLIMDAAAKNLVPVTLELGGKSPVMISRSASIKTAVERIFTVKTFNAGQICLAPDYVLIPEESLDDFVALAQEFVEGMYPTLKANSDYTSIINTRNFHRLQNYLSDAKEKGARVIEINPAAEDLSDEAVRKIAPTLVVNVTSQMQVLHEEIFGPILPVVTYKDFGAVIDYVNSRPRPLAAYYFGEDAAERQLVLERTTSGAVVVNDVMTHVFIDDLPFGGVGYSGMGAYHGIQGFRNFSHAKTVLLQSSGGESNLPMRAPHRDVIKGVIDYLLQP